MPHRNPVDVSTIPAKFRAPSDSSAGGRELEAERVNVVVVGHVDHGKSTFVGRLLHDTNSLPEGKIEQAKKNAEAEGMPFEYAFLLDALLEEQEQNITIDTTRIYFHTKKRKYAIIDAPGHREFLKNMITGASSAAAAFLLIDASEGVQDQTRRHAFLLSLLGIRQIVVLINKMDLASYSEDRYKTIVAEYTTFLRGLGIKPAHFIPIAARHGVNIVENSPETPWYQGPTVVTALDGFEAAETSDAQPLRLPLQDIYRYDDRRLYAGRIDAGKVKLGDRLVFNPGNKLATIASFETWNAPGKDAAAIGESVTLMFNERLFVERGNILSLESQPPLVGQNFRARVFWLGKNPLKQQTTYKLRLTTQEVACVIPTISRVIDSSTLDAVVSPGGQTLQVNRFEVADLVVRTQKPIAFDSHDDCTATGRFVIMEDSHIVGGGIILVDDKEKAALANNVHAHHGDIDAKARAVRNGHAGTVLWFTGLSGSGKSTIAAALERRLFQAGKQVYWLDGDNLRTGLNAGLGFTEADRAENIRRTAEVAKILSDAGQIVIVSTISPLRSLREKAREIVGEKNFLEIYVNAPVDVCRERDPKGLYAKADAGQIPNFTGVSAPYEAPEKPAVAIRADEQPVEVSVEQIVEVLHFSDESGAPGGDI